MKRPKLPTMQIEVGEESYVVGDLMASEYEWMSAVTKGEITNREQLVQGIETKDPQAWKAIIRVMRKRGGDSQQYSEVDVAIDAAEYSFIDEDGQEIEPALERKSCGAHEFTLTCDDCELIPVVDDLYPVWVYVEDPERRWVPTKRAKVQPSPAPSL